MKCPFYKPQLLLFILIIGVLCLIWFLYIPLTVNPHISFNVGSRNLTHMNFTKEVLDDFQSKETNFSEMIVKFKDQKGASSTGCDSIKPTVLLYNRIFKTGSTTMVHLMKSWHQKMGFALQKYTTEDWFSKKYDVPYPDAITVSANKLIGLQHNKNLAFIAHFYFRTNLMPYNYSYINQVRDPVQRVISHYFYIHRSKKRPLPRIQELERSGLLNESLEDCLKNQHRGCENNVMTKFFCGPQAFCRTGNTNALERAKYNIHNYYASVGIMEHFDVYLKILQKRLPGFFPVKIPGLVPKKISLNQLYRLSEVKRETLAAIENANSADRSLYRYIEKRFWEQAKHCGVIT